MAKQQSADVSDPAAGLNSLPEIARPARRWLPLNFTQRQHVEVPLRWKRRDVSSWSILLQRSGLKGVWPTRGS
jgi:hypothetical protein